MIAVRPMFAVRNAILMLAIAAAATPALAIPAPRLGLDRVDQLATPLPLPYDAQADASTAVAAAERRAKASGKLLLIDLGGNWCLDCRVLAGILEVPKLHAFAKRHYEIVTVDIGRMDKNQQIAARFGIQKLEGVPALLIVDPHNGKLVNVGHISALADARHMTPQALADWLAQWI